MRAIDRFVDKSARVAARITRKRSYVDGFRYRRRAYSEKLHWYLNALRDARRSYSQVRDELDMDHLRVMLGFWLSDDSNCVDIGANRGSVLQMIEERAPKGEHHAFEPIPHLARRLRESFPKVSVHEVALADARGVVEFTVVDRERDSGYSGISQSLQQLPAKWSTHPITVDTARLDDMLPPDYDPTFIKIDVEGAELGVLRGAREVLTRCRPILFIEHGAGSDTGEIHDLLTGIGYAIHNVDGDGPYEHRDAMVAGANGPKGSLWNWVCIFDVGAMRH